MYSDETWIEALTYKEFIHNLVRNYANLYTLEQSDLIQECYIAVCDALIRRSKEYMIDAFKHYLKRCIRSHLRMVLANTGTLVRYPYRHKHYTFHYHSCHLIESRVYNESRLEEIYSILNIKERSLFDILLFGYTIEEITNNNKSSIESKKRKGFTKRLEII